MLGDLKHLSVKPMGNESHGHNQIGKGWTWMNIRKALRDKKASNESVTLLNMHKQQTFTWVLSPKDRAIGGDLSSV